MPPLARELLMGFCLGAANIIPGVSGGTFLLVFNIYERVFVILSNITARNMIHILSLVADVVLKSEKKVSLGRLKDVLAEFDFIFLLKLIIGATIAIIALSSLMKYLIVHQFSATYAFFFGLIFISIIIPVKMMEHKKSYLLLIALMGAAVTIYVTYAVNPYEKAQKKSDHYQAGYTGSESVSGSKNDDQRPAKYLSFTGNYTTQEYIYALFCGAVSISAMVLPGISGSLVLILMGNYFAIVTAISGLATLSLDHFLFLSVFGIGIVFGGLVFAKLVNMLLKTWYNPTMAFLAGLMAGSLYALWPFKKVMVMARQYIKEDGVIAIVENTRIHTNINILPTSGGEWAVAALFFITGCILMLFFIKKNKSEHRQG